MKYKLIATIAFSSCLTLIMSSCGDDKPTEEQKTEQKADYSGLELSKFGEYAEKIALDLPPILMSIQDEKTFDEALTKLDGIAERSAALAKAAGELPAPEKSELDGLQEKFDNHMMKLMDGGSPMDDAQKHVSDLVGENPDLRPKFKELRNKLRSAMKPLKNVFSEEGTVGSKVK